MADGLLLSLDDVSVAGDDGTTIDTFSLRLGRGEAVMLEGPDDHARALLFRAAAGLEPPNAGRVSLLGVQPFRAGEAELHALRARVGVVFTKPGLLSNLSLEANVAFPIRVHSRSSAFEAAVLAGRRLEQLGLAELRDRFPATLPLAKARLGALARALVLDPELLFFEEAPLALVPEDLERARAVVAGERRRGLAVLATSSGASALSSAMDRVIPLQGGSSCTTSIA